MTSVEPGLSYAEYAARPGLRAGYLAAIDRSTPGGAEFKARQGNDTASMRWGAALHCMVLEPERFAAEYTIGGPVNPKTSQPYGSETKAFSEWALAQTKPILTREEHRLILGMADAIGAHPVARTIRDSPRQTEVSIFWDNDGVQCKARLDCLQTGVLWDIKSARSAKYRPFHHSIVEYGYALQAAWYMRGAAAVGMPVQKFLWIAVENAAPYQIAVYRCSDTFWQFGHDRCDAALETYKQCAAKGVWPTAYAQEEILMEPEKWLLPDEDSIEA